MQFSLLRLFLVVTCVAAIAGLLRAAPGWTILSIFCWPIGLVSIAFAGSLTFFPQRRSKMVNLCCLILVAIPSLVLGAALWTLGAWATLQAISAMFSGSR